MPRAVTRTLSPGEPGGFGGVVKRTTLANGLRIVTEAVPGVRSVSFGIWVDVGSRDETPAQAGTSHFLEHLLFKGTRRRSALDIAAAMDAVGGELNAFTSKEYTCYYARVLDADLPLAVDLVCDMVTDSLLTAEDIDAERGVVLEEIAMHDDDPSDIVHDLFAAGVFGDAPLGRPVLGSAESLDRLRRDGIAEYWERHYAPPGLVVAAAGNLEHGRVVDLVRRALADLEDGRGAPLPARLDRGGPGVAMRGTGASLLDRPTEQAHLVLGGPGLSRRDERRFALGVLSNALGGGMSSRLFQEVRERRGLAYSVYSFSSHYADAGLFGLYAGCAPENAKEVLDVCRDVLAGVAEAGLTEEEVARGRGQVIGGLLLGLEDSGSRMSRVGKGELVHGEVLEVAEIVRRVEAVDADAVAELAATLLADPGHLAVIGPAGGDAEAAAARSRLDSLVEENA
ncbi:MAG: peptidase domain protein [Mycobacterium sp.]|nr:peptidase domain protein [Mycobacterium sp.]